MIASHPSVAEGRFRRVVVAFDGSCDEDLAAVEAGARFAARLHAELLGLFIEDIDLARLAEYPGVTTLGALSAGRQPVGSGQLKTVLRAQLARTRRAMERAAQRQRVQAAFEVRRGRLVAEILTAVAPADLVILGWRGRPSSVMASGTPAAAVLAAMGEASARFVLVPPPSATEGPVVVAYDGTADARDGLAAAADIAGDTGAIEVALLAGRGVDVNALRREAADRLSGIARNAMLIEMPREGVDALVALAQRRRAGLLIIPARLLDPESARRLVEHAPCSVLLVREGRADG